MTRKKNQVWVGVLATAAVALGACSGDADVTRPDAGGAPRDSGLPALDSALPARDSGPPALDSSLPLVDSGLPALDSSLPPVDSGAPPADSGLPAADSGLPAADSGPPPVACTTPDSPPQVITFVASEYANFEVGAKNFEPDAVTGMDTPNTGPYEPVIEVYPTFNQFTIYRPAKMDKPLQVIAWGNGGCAKHGTLHGDFLKELASYGYMTIADGAPGAKDNRGFGGPTSPSDKTQQTMMLDWAFKENERPCSPFYRKLDLKHVAVAGNSCGGLMTMNAAPDPRIATAVLFNSGLFLRDQALYDKLHAPMGIFNGGPEDFAGSNGKLDFEAINNIPIFLANDTRGHGSYLWDDNAGEVGPVAVAWFNWMLRGDQGPTGKGMFVGDGCGMCKKPEVWIDKTWKNLDRIKP